MYDNFFLEIIQSARNVLNSNFSTKEISDKCNVSYTTISELRHEKRDIRKSNLEICNALYLFAKNNNLDQQFLNNEKMKGKFKHIPLSLQINQIVVSFEYYDLFAYGIFKEINNSTRISKPNTLINLDISKSVFITNKEQIYDTYEFGHKFNCRYGGTGPNNLLRFLLQYSALDSHELEDVIFNNSVVQYDFESDTIQGFPSKIEGNSIELYSLNGKLIITLNNYDNSHNEKINLIDAVNDIATLNTILDEGYKFDNKLESFYYIPKEQITNDSPYSRKSQIRYMRNNDIHIVLEYTDYEIWLPYRIYDSIKDVYLNDELKAFYNTLGIVYDHSSKGLISTLTNKVNYNEIRKLT